MLQKQDKPDVMQGIGAGADSNNNGNEPNNSGNRIVLIIVGLLIAGIILSIIF